MNSFSAERNNCRRKLILMVKQHPILWNKTQENYNRNRPQKLQTWQEISETLGVSVDKIRRTWENLRDQYRRDLKREVKYGFKSKWRFFDDMDFIRVMVTCKGQLNEFTDSDSEVEPNNKKPFVRYEFDTANTNNTQSPQMTRAPTPPQSSNMLDNSSKFQPILLSKEWQQLPTTNNISDMAALLEPMEQLATTSQQHVVPQPPSRQPSPKIMQTCDSSKNFKQYLPNPLELMEMLTKREPESECVAAIAGSLANNTVPGESNSRPIQCLNQEAYVTTSSLKRDSFSMEDNTTELPRTSATIKRKKSSESADLDARDEDYYFVMSLLPSMRQIPCNRKIALRIGIMNLIANGLEEVCK